jgi:hypothetical protein
MKSRTPAQSAKQSARTSRNKVKKYQKLIAKFPKDKDVPKWENEIRINS